MFASIRRHQNWVWYIVVVVIIISFVVFFSPASKQLGGGGGGPDQDFGKMNGRAISREDYAQAQKEAMLDYFFQYARWPNEASKSMGFDLGMATSQRLALAEELRQMKIDPGLGAAADWIKQVFRPAKDQSFSLDFYNQFINQTFKQQGIDGDNVQLFALREVGRQQLIALYGMAGELVPPQEVEVIYRREFTPSLCDAAFFSITNYLSSVSAPESALLAFYTNNISDYSLPARMQVEYVRYPGSNYVAEIERQPDVAKAIAAKADEVYAKEGPSHYPDAQGNPLPAAAAKEKIRGQIRIEATLLAARRAANDFLRPLLERASTETNAFNKVAAEQGLQIKVSSIFDEKNGPAELDSPANFRRAAFTLSPENPLVPSAVVTEDAVFVMAFHQRIPSEPQPFATVRERVIEDYKNAEAFKLAYAAGENFASAATNALAAGKSFAQLCASQKVIPVALPAFAPSTRSLPEIENRVPLRDLQIVAFELPPGRVSGFVRVPEGGMVVYLRAKAPLDEAKMKVELPAFAEQVRRKREYMCFNEWLSQQHSALYTPPQASQRN